MEKIKSLDDLRKIKEKVQLNIALREKSEHPECLIQVRVGMSTCGIAAGSKDTMEYFITALHADNIPAIVTQTGCRGYCEVEPIVEIIKPGCPPVAFGDVHQEKAREIIDKYIKLNKTVAGTISIQAEI